ncbi:lantibiotic dehydratase [Frankia sp. R82]|uniref:lantibiotic dehydratase n=1 Tax=Frankia sp. R82 TaxID=2950553 RepID=UPI002043B19F|nr:lantibiotic dehydratase [Frankia sp. R82]MCM3884298.1 lantibiotic dehydratase [Frankia sp. R82]
MYQHLDSLVVRAAVNRPATTEDGRWPDLLGQAAAPESWRRWLRRVMQDPDFWVALEQASPVLARRVREICDGQQVSESAVRRAVLSVMRYLLRASGRATPFGLFAGVASARLADRPSARIGAAHRAVARVDGGWLTAVIERLEADSTLRPHLRVVANNLVFERDGYFVLEHRPSAAAAGAPTHVQVRATTPIRVAMDMADRPILIGDLAVRLRAKVTPVPLSVVDTLLAALVEQRLLITNLRPATTASSPLDHVVGVLQSISAGGQSSAVATIAAQLGGIADGLRAHDGAADWDIASRHRVRLADEMAAICPTAKPALGVDLRMDWDLAVPRLIADEAAATAAVLVRLARRPTLSRGWDAWHSRFLERYGPHALVPVRDAVDAGIGLGYPAGYLGAPAIASTTLTERDMKLLTLAQKAALGGETEILLNETMINDLTVVDAAGSIQPTTELTVRIHAASRRSVSEGEFALAIVGVSRSAGTTTGRFLDLFDDEDHARMSAPHASLATVSHGALTVQISAPTRYTTSDNVARSPHVMAHLLSLGEYHEGGSAEGGGQIALDDIAVTADAHRIYLISISRRQMVEPVVLNAVEPSRYAHPLVRFLAEATVAMSIPCTSFDWGAAAGLPFLPALRHGRAILSPARWLLVAADLPAPAASWEEWERLLASWRERVRLPRAIYLGEGDQRIMLDLSEPAHRALLRTQLDRAGTVVLRAAPDAEGAGWIEGYAHEIVIPLAAAGPPTTTAPWRKTARLVGRDHGYLPGCDGRFFVKLYARPDSQSSILTRHLPYLVTELDKQVNSGLRWWFLRYHDPEEHLRVRLVVPADEAAPTAAWIGAWTQRLRRAGLVSHVQWDTCFPEAARFGGTAALEAAEAYFAADSAAALAQLAASSEKDGPDVRALTAASMLDITIGLISDAAEAMTWLIEHTRTEPSAPARALYRQAIALANPTDQRDLATQPFGTSIISSWTRRREALATYRRVLRETGTASPAVLLPDLLHLHHARMVGTDLTGERACLHLARAAALSWTARAGRTS